MPTLEEIIRQQAGQIKANSNTIEAAKLLRLAADKLDGGVKKEDSFSSLIQQRKQARFAQLEKLSNAFAAMREKPALKALGEAGYTLQPGSGDIKSAKSTWIKKGTALKIIIEGNIFTAYDGATIKADKLDLNLLPDYLAKANKPLTQPDAKFRR